MGAIPGGTLDCESSRNLTVAHASCPLVALPQVEGDTIDILTTIHFSEVPSDSQVYLGIASLEDTLANAEPIGLGPGSNLHGTAYLVIKNRLTSMKNAIVGIAHVSKE